MIHFLIVLYGLSLTEAYNIRISGKIELGEELSKIFKEAYTELRGVVPTEISTILQTNSPGRTDDAAIDKIPTQYKNIQLNNNEEETAQDLTVLDKMVQNEEHNVHLYGNHKLKTANNGGPLNNVNFRSV